LPFRVLAAPVLTCCLSLLCLVSGTSLPAQSRPGQDVLPPGPMLNGGRATLKTSSLTVELLRSSGTVSRLSPSADPALDYTPGDRLQQRSADTFYHLGDLDLRVKTGDSGWQDFSTAFERHPVSITASGASSFTADLTPTLPSNAPVHVVRTWAVENGDLVLRYTVTNVSSSSIDLGGVGIPMVFNNILSGRTLEESYRTCSFYDPYIGEEAGYVQVVPLSGKGPVLLVVPDGHTPFEAWKPILDRRDRTTGKGLLGNDPTPRSTTFEGSYDWMVHSAAFAQMEWKGVKEWNPSTDQTLQPGTSVTFGLRFLVAPGLRQIESTLAQHRRPVAVGIPGYILPQDIDGRLFLRYHSPVHSIVSEPAEAIAIHEDGQIGSELHAYTLHGRKWGPARLVITYDDGTVQAIPYRTMKSETEAVADMGHFLFHQQWFTDETDPFHRAPSVISYDDSTGSQVTQDPRVWIAGLSDEAGAGSWLAAAMKEYVEPDSAEVTQLESFLDGVLWGHLQESSGPHQYGVHKSLFFYQPDLVPGFPYNSSFNWKSWTSWDKKAADDVGRSYNYPHVVAAYWSLYRIARNSSGLATKHSWDWYLNQAFETTLAMRSQAPYYTKFGQMEGTVFLRLLEDMRAEGWTEKADQLEAMMRARADLWKTEPYPFGSEMPWDSTGQEEVYGWSRFFDDSDKADVTLNAILAYTPVLPGWGYNGSARRYWDFLYGGKYPRIERQLHHYGSGLNAIPLLDEYRMHPEDLYLLRAGYGGVMGPLTNIDQKGFASAAFHSFPDRMAFDPYTGDYGPNFFGHAINTATYLTHDSGMGWLSFGGNVSEHNGWEQMTVLDSLRQRVFLAPLSLWITLDEGRFVSVELNLKERIVRLNLVPATAHVAAARLRLKVTTPAARQWSIVSKAVSDAGAYVVPLGSGETTITLAEK
jgi:hypothetical protein